MEKLSLIDTMALTVGYFLIFCMVYFRKRDHSEDEEEQ